MEEKAIRYIAKAGDGSMRDALSLLDQCIAFYLGQKLTYDHVLEVLGAVDTEVFSRMLRKIMEKDITGVIGLLEELMIQGREPGQFVVDFTWYLRNLLLVQSSDNMEDVLDISSDNLALLKEEAQMIDAGQLMRYIRVFSELSNQIRYATQKRVMIEIALIKLCKPEMEEDYASLAERIAQLEKRMEEGVPLQMAAMPNQMQTAALGEIQSAAAPAPRPQLPKAIPEDVQQVVKNWRSILEGLSGMLKNYLKPAHLSLGGESQLLIVLEDEVAEELVNSEAHKKELMDAIAARIGKEVDVKIQLNQTNRPFEESFPDIGKLINMEITIED